MTLLWRDWNNAIGQATFSTKEAGRDVYLAIDREEIERIGGKLDPEDGKAYESFRAAVIAEVQGGWSFPDRILRDGEFPAYLGVLAAQVVAAFQMHDEGLTSANAYWRRLREFLGQSSEDKRPDGLDGRQHKALWKGLRRWANKTNGGRLGVVRLVEKVGGRHLVAEPLGQCLFRRVDLEKLRGLFAGHGRPDPEPHRDRRLKVLVDDARRLPGKYFTKHSRRVLDDENRFDAAWEQVEAEYERFLEEDCPLAPPRTPPPPISVRRRRCGTTVLLQIVRKGLIGGLYTRGDGSLSPVNTDIGDVLWRCYLRTGRDGSKPPHKPPHDNFLLATRDDEYGAYEERSTCRAGVDALLLVPEGAGQAWLDDADPRLFVEPPKCFRPSLGVDRPGWAPLEGLPERWLALRFKTREDLSDVTSNGKWIGVVDRRAVGLRAVGGLTLRWGVWMLGAGPTVQVVGPGSFDHILVDDKPHPLDVSRCATLDLAVGAHCVHVPGSDSRPLRLQVKAPRRAAPGEFVGWHWVDGEWPASAAEHRRIKTAPGFGTLHGAGLLGDWPARESQPTAPETPSETIPDELAALILAVRLRSRERARLPDPRLLSAARASNPLLRALLRASRPPFVSETHEVSISS